jgi:Transglutaminase-like superfamily
MKTTACILFFLLYMLNCCLGQHLKNRFSITDSYALNTPSSVTNNLDSLSSYLTKPFTEEMDKIRSIYTWISTNVSYDYEKLNARENQPNVKDPSQQADFVLHRRMAVCEGYSNLFYELCKKSAITCAMIGGFSKQDNEISNVGHEWNAVKIKNDWKLLDATWSAGYLDSESKKFTKKFNDTYFLKDPVEFLTDHYPSDVMWQLVTHPITKAEFKSGKTQGDETITFHYSDTIFYYLNSDSTSQKFNSYKRILRYDPYNKTTAVNLMIEKMNQAVYQLNEGVHIYNQCIAVINEAKIKRQPKVLNTGYAFLTNSTTQAKIKTDAAQKIFYAIQFSDEINLKLLKENTSTAELLSSAIAMQMEYLNKFYKTWKPFRVFVL